MTWKMTTVLMCTATAVLLCGVAVLGDPVANGDALHDAAIVQIGLQSWLAAVGCILTLIPRLWRRLGRTNRWCATLISGLAAGNVTNFLAMTHLYAGRMSSAGGVQIAILHVLAVVAALATMSVPINIVFGLATWRGRVSATNRGE